MKTIEEIHRDNLQALAREAGGVAAVAMKIGCSSSQYSQWMNGSENSGTGKPRGMRPSSARRIEKACGKPSGWMDKEHPAVDATTVGGGSADMALTKGELRMLAIFRRASQSNPVAKAVIDDALTVAQGLLDEAFFQQNQG